MQKQSVSRGNIVAAFFEATFKSWINLNKSGREAAYVGYSPVIGFDGDKILSPSHSGGRPLSRCGRTGTCTTIGAAVDLEFPAVAFTSDFLTVQVIPPEGDPVSVDFDLTRLR